MKNNITMEMVRDKISKFINFITEWDKVQRKHHEQRKKATYLFSDKLNSESRLSNLFMAIKIFLDGYHIFCKGDLVF